MDLDTPSIPVLSDSFLDSAATVTEGKPSGSDCALLAYALVYSASGAQVCLREKDQILPIVSYHHGHDTLVSAGTGSGKTMQIIAAALLNPGGIILVLSPLLKLQNTMVSLCFPILFYS